MISNLQLRMIMLYEICFSITQETCLEVDHHFQCWSTDDKAPGLHNLQQYQINVQCNQPVLSKLIRTQSIKFISRKLTLTYRNCIGLCIRGLCRDLINVQISTIWIRDVSMRSTFNPAPWNPLKDVLITHRKTIEHQTLNRLHKSLHSR